MNSNDIINITVNYTISDSEKHILKFKFFSAVKDLKILKKMVKLKKFVIVILLKESFHMKKDADKEKKDVIDLNEKEVVKKNLNKKKVVIEENVMIEEMIKKEVMKNDVIKEKVVIKDVAENKIKKKNVNEKNAVVNKAVMKIKEF